MLLILGEHDKGTGMPFHPKTVSGRRLRGILFDIGLNAILGNVWDYDEGTGATTLTDLRELASRHTGVVALGHIVADEYKRQGVDATYLPHPAARGQKPLEQLRSGLMAIKHGEGVMEYRAALKELSEAVSDLSGDLDKPTNDNNTAKWLRLNEAQKVAKELLSR